MQIKISETEIVTGSDLVPLTAEWGNLSILLIYVSKIVYIFHIQRNNYSKFQLRISSHMLIRTIILLYYDYSDLHVLLNEKAKMWYFHGVKIFVLISNNIFDQHLITRSDCFDVRQLARYLRDEQGCEQAIYTAAKNWVAYCVNKCVKKLIWKGGEDVFEEEILSLLSISQHRVLPLYRTGKQEQNEISLENNWFTRRKSI